MENNQVNKILISYKEQTKNISEALRLAKVPEPLIAVYTFNLPNLDAMLPEDVVKLFKEFRELVIVYLNRLGFSEREISHRIKGDSYTKVGDVLEKHVKS